MALSEREIIVTGLLQRQQQMEQMRQPYEAAMQSAFNYVNPRRYDISGTSVLGAKRQTKMYDGVAQDAFWDWVNGMIGWTVNESERWQKAAFSARQLRDLDAAQRYLDEYTEQMEWEFRNGNFYDVWPELVQDAGSGGTGAMITLEHEDLGHCWHRVPHPGAYWIAENPWREVDEYHEKVPMTAREVVHAYNRPDDTVHPTIKEWASKPDGALWKVDLLECLLPADDAGIFSYRPVPQRYKYVLVTLIRSFHAGTPVTADTLFQNAPGSRLLRIEGISHFYATVWRFRRNSDELYGYSPAMDVLTMIEAAQQHAFNLSTMGNRAADPVKMIPEEMRSEWSFLPGAVNAYGSEKRLAQPFQAAGEYPIAVDRENKIHDLIRKRYGWQVWNAILQLQHKRERVQATEVVEVRTDQARLLTSQLNNMWRGAIAPVYDSVAFLAGRAGRLPAATAELQDQAGQDVIRPQFIGPLSQIQIRATKLGAVREAMGLMAEIAEVVGRHVSPQMAAQVYARVKLSDLVEYICDHSSFPQKLMRTDEETESIINIIEEQAQAEAQARAARELAAASAQLGKEPGPNSVLAKGAA